MELHHEFTVPVPVDDAWRALLDIERVAPCMPGATVDEFDGKTLTGSVKVKVGPVTLTYKGTAVFEEQDDAAHRMVLVAGGREARGQGTARATVTGTLSERDGGTAVSVRTDLTVTGRPAQFGRGVIAEVGDRIIGRFATNLSELLAAPEGDIGEDLAKDVTEDMAEGKGAAAGAPVAERAGRDDALDLVRAAGVPLARRAGPALAAVLVVTLVVVRIRRRRR
ncbi:SRPBCC family protein [Streptomyces sp. NPDC023723]|uniref:SRPBCC family protein n=1 Tax=Streptomyces sp. NPDC023723 TaxID=3154323 RepID=UPI0033C3E2D1